MIIDLEALAYTMKSRVIFSERSKGYACRLENAYYQATTYSKSKLAMAYGHTPEGAADALVHMLRNNIAIKDDQLHFVPRTLIAGEAGKER